MNYKDSIEWDLSQSEYGQSLLSKYRIEEEIYRSSLSHIFKIKELETNDTKILKVIRKQEFDFEIERVKKIDHKNIVKILESGSSDKFLYIIREYVEGVNLERYIEENGPLTSEDVSKMTLKITEAIDYLHSYEEGTLIFRDLKPSNIMVDKEGELILIDIITIRSVKEEKDTDTFYIGSKGYSAPEQYGYMQSDEKSDIYSLGATIFFLSTGQHPESQNFRKEIQTVPSKRIRRVIKKATEFNPEKRHKNIIEFKNDLLSPINKKAFGITATVTTIVLILLFAYNSMLNNQFDVNNIKSADDIQMENLLEITSGIEFEQVNSDTLHITIDRSSLNDKIKDFEYITVGSSAEPYESKNLKDEIYEGLIDKLGFTAYPEAGLYEVLGKRSNIYLAVYSKEKEPLAYYILNDIEMVRDLQTPDPLDQAAHGLQDDEGNEYTQVSDSVKFTYHDTHAMVSVDLDKEVPFTKVAIWSNPFPMVTEDFEHIRNQTQNGEGVIGYKANGNDTGYGATGIRNNQSWFILLLNDEKEIVAEYYFVDPFVASEESRDLSGVVHGLYDKEGIEYTQVSDTVTFHYYQPRALVKVDVENEVSFTHMSVWSNPNDMTEDDLNWIRNEVKTGHGVREYLPTGHDTGYGADGIRDHQAWFILLLDEEYNVVNEYYFEDEMPSSEITSEPVHNLFNEEGIEYTQVSETVTFTYYQPRALVEVDVEKEVPFTHMSIWSNPGSFSEGDKDWIRNEVESGNGVKEYLPTGNDTGYGADGIRDHQAWFILLLDEDYNIVKEYAFKDEMRDVQGVVNLDEGIWIEYYKEYAVAYIDLDLYPDTVKASLWGSGSGLTEGTQSRIRADVETGNGIREYNPDEGYITGYGDVYSFRGQDWMFFLIDENNKIIKEYQIHNLGVNE